MRDIKFRSWDKLFNKYLHFELTENGLNCISSDIKDDWVMTPLDFEQYTGLKDVNGVEIYESDIVEYWHSEHDDKLVGIIKWGDSYPAFDIYDSKGVNQSSLVCDFNILSCPDFNFKVVGNVHQTPELLESL